MMSRKTLKAGFGLAACALALSGCAQFHLPQREGVSAAQKAACHSRVEDAYVAQNRAEIFQSDRTATGSTSPFSTNSYATSRNEGLSSQYAYQRNLDDCYVQGTDPSPTPQDSK